MTALLRRLFSPRLSSRRPPALTPRHGRPITALELLRALGCDE